MPGTTPNLALRYPLGTERPTAAQIKALADDTDAAFQGIQGRVTALETPPEKISSISVGPGFTALAGNQAPTIYMWGPWRHFEGTFTWVNGGMPGGRRVCTVPAEHRPRNLRYMGATSFFYRTGYAAVPVAMHVQDVNGGEIRIPGDNHIAGTLAAGSGWLLMVNCSWFV